MSKVLELPSGNQAEIAAVVDDIGETFLHQAEALSRLARNYDSEDYRQALRLMLESSGHIVVIGIGKSGHVGRKISATLASTGTPSFFLHPAEAFHGDLGMVTSQDVIMLVSNSGETAEIVQLVPSLNAFGNPVIAVTSNPNSTLGRYADVSLDIGVREESCPNNLVPTTSTTVTVSIGDALSVALMNLRHFQATDFAKYHPGGTLGRRLLSHAEDLMMNTGVACLSSDEVLLDMAAEMAGARTNIAVVLDGDGKPIGVVTQEQLAVALRVTRRLHDVKASTIMHTEFMSVRPNDTLEHILNVFSENSISSLLVVDSEGRYLGLLEEDFL